MLLCDVRVRVRTRVRVSDKISRSTRAHRTGSAGSTLLRLTTYIWWLCPTGEGDLAFCSGGDQEVRGKGGYVGADGVPRLNVLDLQVKP